MSFITQRSSFTSKEMRLLQDLDIQVYYKTYKVIYRLGWKVTIMRAQMANGYKPWREFPVLAGWDFDQIFCHPLAGHLTLEEARHEWFQWLDFWWQQVQTATSFEIYETVSMGLGIRAKEDCNFPVVAGQLQGFLHTISYPLFAYLKANRYPSLFEYKTEDGKKVYCILFGLLALVNSDLDIDLGFTITDDTTRNFLNWRCSYVFGVLEEQIGYAADEIVVFNVHELSVLDEDFTDDGVFPFSPENMGLGFQEVAMFPNEKVNFIMRVRIVGFSGAAEIDARYRAGDSIKVAYPLYY